MTADEIRQSIELAIVEFIKGKLAAGKMTEGRSQQISQIVLDILHPGMSYTQLYKAIPKLDDTCPELAPIILPYIKEYEEHISKQTQHHVAELIRQGQYDAATKLAEKAVNQDVEIEWSGESDTHP